MNYNEKFSEDVGSFFRSPVREIFKKVDLNAIYSFAGGYPSADTFPLESIRQTITEVIEKYGAKAFQYGATQGVPELREAVAKRYDVPVERVQITSSSQQGIDVCTRVLVNPGDVILTSSPSYLGALQSFRSYRADIRGVAHKEDLTEFKASYEAVISQVLGEGKVSDEAGFRAAIKETLESQFRVDSDFRFVMDLKKYIVGRVGEVEFPEEILKRIMKLNNQDKDDEFIEKNFKPSVDELKWHLIKEQLCDQLEIKVEQPDVMETAKEVTRMQFAQYGMTNIPEDALENYAKGMLENKQQAEGLVNRTVERKLGAAVKAVVTLDEKTVSLDEFNKAFEE